MSSAKARSAAVWERWWTGNSPPQKTISPDDPFWLTRPHLQPRPQLQQATGSHAQIAAYFANASNVACLGDSPLGDLKYDIVMVLADEKSLLFGPPPSFVPTQEFLNAIEDADRGYDRAVEWGMCSDRVRGKRRDRGFVEKEGNNAFL
ncbi:hypothetical protein VTI74DRAFT_442 [Chaetomium olivicolor]